MTTTTKSVESFFRGNRRSTVKDLGDGVLILELFEDDALVSGQCFTANPSSFGPERALAAARAWCGR